MKIKIITCHNVYNYGASLQAYALLTFLKKKGHDVQIIDYRPEYLTHKYNFWYIGDSSKWKKIAERNIIFHFIYGVKKFIFDDGCYRRKKSFDCFTKQYLQLTSKVYDSIDFMGELSADLFIAGSDQIWNTEMKNGRDAAFYLDFVQKKESKKISYAASFGVSEIAENCKAFVKQKLNSFQNISVRENSGLSILQSLNLTGQVVLDPVFLLTKQDWESLIKNKYSEKYLLVYDFVGDKNIEAVAVALAKKMGLKIYAVNDTKKIPYANKNISNAGPIQFLELLASASFFVSNSFHGTAFSILFEKQFCVLDIKNRKNNSRMRDLLLNLQLQKRLVETTDGINDLLLEKINYEKVNAEVEKMKVVSVDFLNNNFK